MPICFFGGWGCRAGLLVPRPCGKPRCARCRVAVELAGWVQAVIVLE